MLSKQSSAAAKRHEIYKSQWHQKGRRYTATSKRLDNDHARHFLNWCDICKVVKVVHRNQSDNHYIHYLVKYCTAVCTTTTRAQLTNALFPSLSRSRTHTHKYMHTYTHTHTHNMPWTNSCSLHACCCLFHWKPLNQSNIITARMSDRLLIFFLQHMLSLNSKVLENTG